MIEKQYKMPYMGLGTEFSEAYRPLEYAKKFTNRFITSRE